MGIWNSENTAECVSRLELKYYRQYYICSHAAQVAYFGGIGQSTVSFVPVSSGYRLSFWAAGVSDIVYANVTFNVGSTVFVNNQQIIIGGTSTQYTFGPFNVLTSAQNENNMAK